jgi:hypothetical protein
MSLRDGKSEMMRRDSANLKDAHCVRLAALEMGLRRSFALPTLVMQALINLVRSEQF